jgi:predicted nuclease of restriction endonuclease-like (RecB) superfamily
MIMANLINISEYRGWLGELKQRIKNSQIRTVLSVNKELILLYWDLGKQISEKQKTMAWGSMVVRQLSKDLCNEFPGSTGFSRSNLYAMKQFYEFFQQIELETPEFVHPVGGQLNNENNLPEIVEKYCLNVPWRHIVLILQKLKTKEETLFYLSQTIENNWSRNILNIQIENNLYQRKGKAITNFPNTLPLPQADLLNETLKNPYNFDFLTLKHDAREKEVERGLIANISKFMLELGKGFAFLGEQYQLTINDKDYFLDLLFYHVKLHCYVVIELKIGEFEPEYLGKMNFYLSAVNTLLKTKSDNQSIGILLCKNQNSFDVEFALKDINKPIGVSEFSFKELPETIKEGMPSEEELNNELINFEKEYGKQ